MLGSALILTCSQIPPQVAGEFENAEYKEDRIF